VLKQENSIVPGTGTEYMSIHVYSCTSSIHDELGR
jgi:hypothetical protein